MMFHTFEQKFYFVTVSCCSMIKKYVFVTQRYFLLLWTFPFSFHRIVPWLRTFLHVLFFITLGCMFGIAANSTYVFLYVHFDFNEKLIAHGYRMIVFYLLFLCKSYVQWIRLRIKVVCRSTEQCKYYSWQNLFDQLSSWLFVTDKYLLNSWRLILHLFQIIRSENLRK